MATNLKLAKFLDCYGPDSVVALVNFTTAGTGAVTTNEAQGVTVARTGVGTYLLTFARGWKAITVTTGFQFSTSAQIPLITAISAANRTVTITVVGAGGTTAADTTGATIHIQAILRKAV